MYRHWTVFKPRYLVYSTVRDSVAVVSPMIRDMVYCGEARQRIKSDVVGIAITALLTT